MDLQLGLRCKVKCLLDAEQIGTDRKSQQCHMISSGSCTLQAHNVQGEMSNLLKKSSYENELKKPPSSLI